MKRRPAFWIVAALAGWPWSSMAQPDNYWHLETGPLTLDIYVSKTAHLFHVVDQISQWSEFCHRQYSRYFDALDGGINAADRERLAEHTALRKTQGWGGGLERTFYRTVDLETALAQGVQAGWLTEPEAQIERRVIKHFQPRVERLLSEESPVLDAFGRQLSGQRTNLTAMAQTLSRFVGDARITVPVYLIANPDDTMIGGGFNGGRLTLEVPRKRDAYPSLLHELFHAFLRTKQPAIESAARSAPGLSAETLSEGLAYAYHPGIVHATDTDPLLETVAGYLAQGASLSDAYTRFNAYGLALRPLLKEALADPRQTVGPFLPRAVDAWRVLTEIDRARSIAPKSPLKARGDYQPSKRSIFIFGLWDEAANQAISEANQRNLNLFGRLHVAEEYHAMLTQNAQPGDTIISTYVPNYLPGRPPKLDQTLGMSEAQSRRQLQFVFEQNVIPCRNLHIPCDQRHETDCIDKAARRAKEISVRADRESIGGSLCHVIEVTLDPVKHGQLVDKTFGGDSRLDGEWVAAALHTLWLDPEHGDHIAKAVSVYSKPLGKGTFLRRDTRENVRFAQMDGVWLPVEMDMTAEEQGTANPNKVAAHYKITSFARNPDHEAHGSFRPSEVANGALVVITRQRHFFVPPPVEVV